MNECNNQLQSVQFKYNTTHPKISPVVVDIMRRLNHSTIDNGDVEVRTSEYLFESTNESVTIPDTTPTK